jgi:DNA polymerase-1
MSRPTLFLIDGSSQMYRAYHAFRGKGLSNQEGHATHAVYVFVTMLRKLIADHKPAYIGASFDLAGPTFRDQIADDYKANRAAMPDDQPNRSPAHEACDARRADRHAGGYEADDVIGTLAGAVAADRLAIVSIDKDFFQLVQDGIRVYDPREDGAWFDAAGVADKFGVPPAHVVDVLALVGDTSDNVAGVPGIGKKGAIDLVSKYGGLDSILDRAAELKGKQGEALVAHRADALKSRELVIIKTDVRLLDLESCAIAESASAAYALFTGWRFLCCQRIRARGASKGLRLVRSLDELDGSTTRCARRISFRLIPAIRGDAGGSCRRSPSSSATAWHVPPDTRLPDRRPIARPRADRRRRPDGGPNASPC